MRGIHLGELEELILLAAGSLYDEAYGVAIIEEIKKQTGRELNISAAHAVLRRLEEKELLTSRMGGATNQRGGRRKRLFTLTMLGKKAIDESMAVRSELYNRIPKLTYNFSS